MSNSTQLISYLQADSSSVNPKALPISQHSLPCLEHPVSCAYPKPD